MKRFVKMFLCIALVVGGYTAFLSILGCDNDAMVASRNLSQAADMFEIDRRVVFYNGITNEYILVVEGKCSIKVDNQDHQLELTCKTGPETYKKHFLGLSDNVTYFSRAGWSYPEKFGTWSDGDVAELFIKSDIKLSEIELEIRALFPLRVGEYFHSTR